MTFGELFWPRSHIDQDLWYTVLVALDIGQGVSAGGDFSFAECGWVLGCEHGDVLIYSPRVYHGTTEFAVSTAHDSRVFAAFYMKAEGVAAAALTHAVECRVGHRPMPEFGFL